MSTTTEKTEKTEKVEYDKEFVIEVAVKINVLADALPDAQAQEIIDKIKTKVFCNRESMTLVGILTDAYEVYKDEED